MFRWILVLLVAVSSACALSASAADVDVDIDMSYLDLLRPFLEVDYGVSTPRFDRDGADFESVGLLEFKLGYGAIDSVRTGISSLMQSFLFVGFANPDLGFSNGDDAEAKLNRFGFGNRLGYGYQGTSTGLDLYNQNSTFWAKLSASDYDAAAPEAQAVFDRYGSKYRFGLLTEAGANFRLSPRLALSAGAEGAIVYPRFVFWPWLGSTLLYSAVQGVVEFFGDDVMSSSSGAGPVVYWLLKSGLSLGYYLAIRSDMNWPFDSETPLTTETFRLGATFTF